MSRMIFVNLPVRDLGAATAFYTALGFRIDEEYSDDTAACVVVEEGSIFAMLLTHEKFREFITGDIAEPGTTEVLTCITAPTQDDVDELLRRALDAGGTPWKPTASEGPMYYTSFADPDGHVWEVMAMPGS